MTACLMALVMSLECRSCGVFESCAKYVLMHVWVLLVWSRIVVRRRISAVTGHVSVPVTSWCTLWFVRPLFGFSMLRVAEVQRRCSVEAGSVCSRRFVPSHRAMSCTVNRTGRRCSVYGWCVYSLTRRR